MRRPGAVRGRLERLEGARPSARLLLAQAALRDLGRGLAAVAAALDDAPVYAMTGGCSMTKVTGGLPALARVAADSAPGASLMTDLARALAGAR